MSLAGRPIASRGYTGSFQSIKTFCCVSKSTSANCHLFTAEKHEAAKTVLATSKAMKADKIDRFFINEDDRQGVLDAFRDDKPKIYTFNRVFNNTTAIRINATANFVVMSTADGVFRHFFDVHSEFGAEVFAMMSEHQDEISIKMSYLLQETEIDLIDYQGPGNILKVESQYDLKNAFDVGYFLVSFKSGNSEINFVFTPVFVKNFKLTEAYSTWSQLKSLILNVGQDPTYNSPNRQAIIGQLRQKLPASRLCLVGFVEAAPEKFHGSVTTLDEMTKLYLDLKGVDHHADSASARRMSQTSSTQENQLPEEGDDEADDRHREFLESCEQYIASGTELMRTGTDIDTIQEWLNQAEPHQHKLEMMLESCKNQQLADLNKRLQRKLKSLRDNLQDQLYSPRQDLNQSESSHSQTHPNSKSRPGPSSQKEVSGTFQHSKLYGGDTASQTLGLPPQSPGGVSSLLRGPTSLPKRKNSNLLGMQVYDTSNPTPASTYQRKFNPEEYNHYYARGYGNKGALSGTRTPLAGDMDHNDS